MSKKKLQLKTKHSKCTKNLEKFCDNPNKYTKLNITNKKLNLDDVIQLKHALEGNKTLLDLTLSNCGLDNNAMKIIGASLAHNTTLKTLNLSKNKIGYEGILSMQPYFFNSYILDSFNLSHNEINHEGVLCLAVLMKDCLSLEYLNLSHNLIDYKNMDSQYTTGLAMLLMCQSLKILDLSHNKIGYNGAKALAFTSMANKGLEMIDLNNSCIDQDGQKALWLLLSQYPSLEINVSDQKDENILAYDKKIEKALSCGVDNFIKSQGLLSLSQENFPVYFNENFMNMKELLSSSDDTMDDIHIGRYDSKILGIQKAYSDGDML